MMRERREVDSKLRRQLGKCLFWPLNSGAKEDEAMKVGCYFRINLEIITSIHFRRMPSWSFAILVSPL